MKRFALTLMFTFSLTVPLLAGDGGVLPAGRWWRKPELAAKLQLTNEQQTKLDTISLNSAKQLVDLKADVEKRTIDLRGELDAERLDRGRIQRAAAALSEARGRMFERELMLMVDMREVLSTEQWNQLRLRVVDRQVDRQGDRPLPRPMNRPRKNP